MMLLSRRIFTIMKGQSYEEQVSINKLVNDLNYKELAKVTKDEVIKALLNKTLYRSYLVNNERISVYPYILGYGQDGNIASIAITADALMWEDDYLSNY